MRATGSIPVERIAKPMKHKVLNKYRNRLGHVRGSMCLRVGLNLRLLATSKEPLKAALFANVDTLEEFEEFTSIE